MTREQTESQGSSDHSYSTDKRQQRQHQMSIISASQNSAVKRGGGCKRAECSSSRFVSSGKLLPHCGPLVQRRHDKHGSHLQEESPVRPDFKGCPLSELDASSSTVQLKLGFGSPLGTGNNQASDGLSMEPQVTDRHQKKKKKQLIYYQGNMKIVRVQHWPVEHRIPLHERHRLQEPMKHHYGKKSNRARLLKECEMSHREMKPQAIPLLPKRVRDEAKIRLMAWYRPLELPNTDRLCVPDDSLISLPARRTSAIVSVVDRRCAQCGGTM